MSELYITKVQEYRKIVIEYSNGETATIEKEIKTNSATDRNLDNTKGDIEGYIVKIKELEDKIAEYKTERSLIGKATKEMHYEEAECESRFFVRGTKVTNSKYGNDTKFASTISFLSTGIFTIPKKMKFRNSLMGMPNVTVIYTNCNNNSSKIECDLNYDKNIDKLNLYNLKSLIAFDSRLKVGTILEFDYSSDTHTLFIKNTGEEINKEEPYRYAITKPTYENRRLMKEKGKDEVVVNKTMIGGKINIGAGISFRNDIQGMPSIKIRYCTSRSNNPINFKCNMHYNSKNKSMVITGMTQFIRLTNLEIGDRLKVEYDKQNKLITFTKIEELKKVV